MHVFALKSLLACGFALVATATASAAPVLKAEVEIVAAVVTVGDMFENSGDLATKSLFLAPAPGTAGLVPIADVRAAAAKAGVLGYDEQGATTVRVSRLGTAIDQAALTRLLVDDLRTRGILEEGMTADALFDTPIGGLEAAAVANPVQLVDLRYMPGSGTFSARFMLAGRDAPLDLSGRLDLMVAVPQLVTTLPAGTILKASDFTMQPMPLKFAQNGNVATPNQLVGKQLLRQSRAGMVLKASDVADPELVSRNGLVTVYLHSGSLTLTIKGTALNAASLGQPVAVLNLTSKKVVHGVARADGAVEIPVTPLSVAGL
jgi:flagella basal body P-ring formation protein FlgA